VIGPPNFGKELQLLDESGLGPMPPTLYIHMPRDEGKLLCAAAAAAAKLLLLLLLRCCHSAAPAAAAAIQLLPPWPLPPQVRLTLWRGRWDCGLHLLLD